MGVSIAPQPFLVGTSDDPGVGRKYFGRIYAEKSYRGAKSVNLVVAGPMGVELAIAILKATKNGARFDLAIHDMGHKEGPVLVTVTTRE